MSFNYTSLIELGKLRSTGKVTTRKYLQEQYILPLFPENPSRCIVPIIDSAFPHTCSMMGMYGTPCPHKEQCREKHKKGP